MTGPSHDHQERERALDPTQSFVVQAPAGSGKTELLIQRFLKLLSGVNKPEHILAMTFTRKAAGEMRTRIIQALQLAAGGGPPDSAHERNTYELARAALERDEQSGWRLLDNPLRLKIQTIDSFCMSLIKQTPVLSGIGAMLDIEENPEELYRETARRMLTRVEHDTPTGEAVRALLVRLDNSKSAFLDRMVQLLKHRDRWMLTFFETYLPEPPSSQNRQDQEDALKLLVESRLGEVDAVFPPPLKEQLLPLLRYAGANVHADNPEHDLAVLKDIRNFPEPHADRLPIWQAIAQMLITQGGEFRKPKGVTKSIGFPPKNQGGDETLKQEFQNLLESPDNSPALAAALHETASLPDPRFEDADWEFLDSMLTLLPEIEKTLRGVFVQTGKTDYSELSLSALKSLGGEMDPTDLLLKYDLKLQHILVDEFQDTSYKQYRLLELLTEGWTPDEGRTLFIVGDPMQSIYRFRDAEVSFFTKAVRDGIGPVPMEPLRLTSNFRSQAGLVDWVNACFQALDETTAANGDVEGAIPYREASHAELPALPGPAVVSHPFRKTTGGHQAAGEGEASQMIDVIRDLQKRQPDASIAILVRARTHLESLAPHLREAGIPLRAEKIDTLTTRPAVLDLWSLMRALLDVHDRIAWLSILRAPWCGLRLEDLHRLCVNDSKQPVWRLMNDPARQAALSADAQHRVRRMIEKLGPVLDALPSQRFRDLLEGSWIDLGGPACIDPVQGQDVRVFFDEISRVLEAGNFDALYRFDRVLDNLYASPPALEGNPVQIMTMHQAKGLEFDHVLLPGLGKDPRAGERQLIFWLTHSDRMLFAPIQQAGQAESGIYRFLKRLDKTRDTHETRRLLYVSVTRARIQLHLFGHLAEGDGGIKPPSGNSMLGHLWPFVCEEWETRLREERPAPAEGYRPQPKPRRLRRLPRGFELPEPPPGIDTGRPLDIQEEREDRPPYFWAGNRARCLGIVLHRCFKSIADEGVENWNRERIESLKPRLRAALLNEGLSFEDADAVLEKGMQALHHTLEDAPSGRWILQRHAEAQSEYALTGSMEGGAFANKIIDRTFVDEHGVRWIVDYKTGEHEGADLERFFESESERYRPQLEAYAALFRNRGETRPIKKALYYPLYRRLIELA